MVIKQMLATVFLGGTLLKYYNNSQKFLDFEIILYNL